MSDAKADAVPPNDPFAAQKTNIRDTIKWMVAAYSGVAAVLIAGVSLSGLGSLPASRLVIAAISGALVLIFVLAALSAILRLLIGDNCFAGDIDPAVITLIDQHAEDILPARFSSWEEFLTQRRQARADVQRAWRLRHPATAPVPAPTQAQLEALERNLRKAVELFDAFERETRRIVGQAHLFTLQIKLRDLRGRLATLTVLGVIALVVCIWALTVPKPNGSTPQAEVSVPATGRHPLG